MAVPRIDSYHFGRIVIDGRSYTHDVIIYPDHVDGKWWRAEGHSVSITDLWDVIQARPEVLVIGQGSVSRMDVPAETRRALQEAGITVIAEPTGQACETYNRLSAQRQVIAALHLTC